MTKPARLTKTQRLARQKMGYYMWLAQWEDEVEIQLRDQVPQAWHRLEHDLDVVEPKTRVTLRLDASVAKFYRAMGQGYQARISRILATYAQMQIAEALRKEHTAAQYVKEMEGWKDEVPEDVAPGAGE